MFTDGTKGGGHTLLFLSLLSINIILMTESSTFFIWKIVKNPLDVVQSIKKTFRLDTLISCQVSLKSSHELTTVSFICYRFCYRFFSLVFDRLIFDFVYIYHTFISKTQLVIDGMWSYVYIIAWFGVLFFLNSTTNHAILC